MNAFSQQPTLRPCPECGGRRVAGHQDKDINLRAELRTPSGHPLSVSLRAAVCTVCGHVSIYARDLAPLYEDIQKHPDNYRY